MPEHTLKKEANTDLRNREWLMRDRGAVRGENVRTDSLQSTVMDDWLDNA